MSIQFSCYPRCRSLRKIWWVCRLFTNSTSCLHVPQCCNNVSKVYKMNPLLRLSYIAKLVCNSLHKSIHSHSHGNLLGLQWKPGVITFPISNRFPGRVGWMYVLVQCKHLPDDIDRVATAVHWIVWIDTYTQTCELSKLVGANICTSKGVSIIKCLPFVGLFSTKLPTEWKEQLTWPHSPVL